MPDGQNLNAGQFNTAETTTDFIADGGNARRFNGNVIFRVGPSSLGCQGNVFSNVVDGIYGLAADGGGDKGTLGTGVVGFGSPHGGTGVQGLGGAFKPPGQTDPRGGIGVQGIGGDADDDGSAGYQPSTGVLGVGGNVLRGLIHQAESKEPGTGVIGIGGMAANVSDPGPGGVGVHGVAGGVADGVVGTSTAINKSGVFGFNSAQTSTAYGVFGRCDAAGGAGVGAESGSGVGVRGHSGANDGLVGLSDANNKSGVYGFNSSQQGGAFGVYGRCNSGTGTGVFGSADNVQGVGIGGRGFYAVVGQANQGGFSGLFRGGPVLVNADLMVTGTKSAVVRDAAGSHRRLFAVEGPESWLEYLGEAELTGGTAEVELDPLFAELIDTNGYHVFLSPYGEATGLHVSHRRETSFVVSGSATAGSSLVFSYRIVARRKDVPQVRMPRVELPSRAVAADAAQS